MVRLLPRHRSTKAMKVMQLLLTLHFFLLLRNHNTAHSARHKSTATDFRLPSGSHELDSTRPRPQPPVRQEEHPPLTRWPTASLTDAALPQPQIIAELPRFREAASFRNGEECAPIHQQKSGGSEQQQQQQQLCDAASVHIAMTLDAAYIRGSIAAVLSIVQHTACPENLAFHFIASRMEEKLSVLLSSTFPYLRFKLYKFDEGILQGKISPSVRNSLEQPLNYARTYIADILPSCIKRVIYLDSDLIVVDDVAKLWRTDLNGHALAAPQYCHVDFSHYFNSVFWENAQLSAVFRGRKLCYFNTGVMVMDLEKWRRSYYVQAIEGWMEVQTKLRIYELGSLPPFLLVFAGRIGEIENRWNQHGLGGDNLQGECRGLHSGAVSLLHWSGKGKPWVRLDAGKPCPLDMLWAPYDLHIKTQQKVETGSLSFGP